MRVLSLTLLACLSYLITLLLLQSGKHTPQVGIFINMRLNWNRRHIRWSVRRFLIWWWGVFVRGDIWWDVRGDRWSIGLLWRWRWVGLSIVVIGVMDIILVVLKGKNYLRTACALRHSVTQ